MIKETLSVAEYNSPVVTIEDLSLRTDYMSVTVDSIEEDEPDGGSRQ